MNKRSLSVMLIAAALGLCGLVALPISPVSAWETVTCGANGPLEHGLHGPVRWNFNQDCIPAGQPSLNWFNAIYQSSELYNNLDGVASRFTGISSASRCGTTPLAQGKWEISTSTGAPLAGNQLGLTQNLFYLCNSGGGTIGANVIIRQTLEPTARPELSATTGVREVVLHELGHVLGMDHDDGRMSLMKSTTPSPRAGRRNGAPADSEGAMGGETFWATDATFAFLFHGDGAAARPDMVASPWTHEGGNIVLHYPNPGSEITRCPGETFNLDYTTANLGNVGADDVAVRIVMSINNNISTSDIVARNTLTSRSSTNWAAVAKTITVPNNTPAALYHIGVIVDPDNALTEETNFNNATETGLRVRVPTGC